jgi:hypothetical protein
MHEKCRADLQPQMISLAMTTARTAKVCVIHNSHLDPQINHRDNKENEREKASEMKCIAPHTRFAFIRRCFCFFKSFFFVFFSSFPKRRREKAKKPKAETTAKTQKSCRNQKAALLTYTPTALPSFFLALFPF